MDDSSIDHFSLVMIAFPSGRLRSSAWERNAASWKSPIRTVYFLGDITTQLAAPRAGQKLAGPGRSNGSFNRELKQASSNILPLT